MTWGRDDGLVVADPEQVVLEADPPRRLSYTWHTFTPEWAASYGVDEERRTRIAAEPRSWVTFELEPDGPLVKLTVIHDGFAPDSTVLQMISGGLAAGGGRVEDPARGGRHARRRPRRPRRLGRARRRRVRRAHHARGGGRLVDARRGRIGGAGRRAHPPLRRRARDDAGRLHRRAGPRRLGVHRVDTVRRVGRHERLVHDDAARFVGDRHRAPARRAAPDLRLLRDLRPGVGPLRGQPRRVRARATAAGRAARPSGGASRAATAGTGPDRDRRARWTAWRRTTRLRGPQRKDRA